MNKTAILIILFLLSGLCFGEKKSNKFSYSSPFVINYPPSKYNGHGQVWNIIQDKRGIMYFANSTGGIMEFDGVNWNNVTLPEEIVVRSFAKNKNHKIFVGFNGDFGYLEVKNGKTHYFSLLNKVPRNHRKFGNVWQVLALNNTIYFRTSYKIFKYYKNKISVIESKDKINRIGLIGNRMLTTIANIGLVEIKNHKIIKAKNGNLLLKNNVFVYSILEYDKKRAIIFSRNKGVYIYDWNKLTRLKTSPVLNNYLKEYKLYCGIKLPHGLYALGTKTGGILLMDKKGNFRGKINITNGLNANNVRSLYLDSANGLWAGLNYGISYIKIFSPYSVYNEKTGIKDRISNFTFHNGKLYIASTIGLYRKVFNPISLKSNFEKINRINSEVWDMISVGSSLLAGANFAWYQIKNGKLYKNKLRVNVFSLKKFKYNNEYVFGGTNSGVIILKNIKGIWKKFGFVKGLNFRIKSLTIYKNNTIFIQNKNNEIYKLYFKNVITSTPKIIKLKSPDKGRVSLFKNINGKLICITNKAFYIYNDNDNTYKKIKFLEGGIKPFEISSIETGKNKRLWIFTKHTKQLLIAKQNGKNSYKISFNPVFGRNRMRIFSVLDNGKNVYLGGFSKIAKYHQPFHSRFQSKFKSIIRSVKANAKHIFGNSSMVFKKNNSFKKAKPNTIEYENNSITFHFSSNAFSVEGENLYRYKLNGLNNKWSTWSANTRANFSNLAPGDYVFYVQCKDIYGNLSSSANFSFSILTPWYKSWLIYFVYAILITFVVFAFSALRSAQIKRKARNLEKEKHLLEKRVADRTKELQLANDLINEDLVHAKQIQNNTISKEYEKIKKLNIDVYFKPMVHVGGDIYDIYEMRPDYFRVFIADATGHGVQAALTTMLIKSEYDKIKIHPIPLSRVVEIFNNIFIKNYYKLTMFFTCIILDIDLSKEEITYISAGHPEQFLIGKKLQTLAKTGPLIGLKEEVKYEQRTIKFQSNAKAVLFTDGIFEEFSPDEEEFGEERLKDLVEKNKNEPPETLNKLIVENIQAWANGADFTDDITLITIENLSG